jgi:hypothetical protein
MNNTQKSLLFWAVLVVTGVTIYWISVAMR